MSEATYDAESHYDRVTSAWGLLLGDELHYGLFATGDEDLPTATRALTDRMVAEARIEPDVEVLDIGCGTGAPACELASLGARVTGITTSAVGIEAATERARAAGWADRTTFVQRDGMDNGFPDASFDRTWALESSHLMRDRGALLSECGRVLRPGGRLALCDIVLLRPMPFDAVRSLRKELALLREVFGDAQMLELATYEQLAADAGLVVETAEDVTALARPTFARWRENATTHREAVVAELGVDDWQRFVDSCDVLDELWGAGWFGYAVLGAVKP